MYQSRQDHIIIYFHDSSLDLSSNYSGPQQNSYPSPTEYRKVNPNMPYIKNIQTITEYINIMFNCYNSFNLLNNYSQIRPIIIKLYKQQKSNHIPLLKYTYIIKFKKQFSPKSSIFFQKAIYSTDTSYQRHLVSVICVFDMCKCLTPIKYQHF